MGLLTPLTDGYAAAGLTDVTVRTKAEPQLCSFIWRKSAWRSQNVIAG